MLKRILLPLVVAVLTAISAAGEDAVPTRDLTCGCQFCEGSGQWQLLNIVRDNLESVTHVATAGGTLLAEYSYDPVTGLFLGHDPVMPEAGLTQSYNSYTYCLNNPLKYTDPDGEWIHIAIGAAIGGTANLIANWGNCDGFWEYAAAFGIGAATGAVSSYYPLMYYDKVPIVPVDNKAQCIGLQIGIQTTNYTFHPFWYGRKPQPLIRE